MELFESSRNDDPEPGADTARRERLAAMFRALGDPTRLRIFDFLRACAEPVAVDEAGAVRRLNAWTEGTASPESPFEDDSPAPARRMACRSRRCATVGEVCCHVTGGPKVTSRMSFHLKELRIAGLIRMERRGRHRVCAVDPDALRLLADHLSQPTDSPGSAPPHSPGDFNA